MSLSKVFKESKHFKPEEILQRAAPKDSTWPSSTATKHAFIETHQEKSEENQPFRQDQPLAPAKSPPPITSVASRSEPEPLQTPGDSPQETEEAEETLAAGIDQLTVDRLIEEAYQRGITEGLKRAESDFGSAAIALLELFRQLDHLRENLLINSFPEMQDLTLAIAEKIIRASVAEQDATIVATVEEAIHRAVKSDEFYIYVNPDDFNIVQEKSADLVAGVSGLNNIVIKKDPTIERGGCKIESDNCIVDATIATQFETLRENIKNRLVSR